MSSKDIIIFHMLTLNQNGTQNKRLQNGFLRAPIGENY